MVLDIEPNDDETDSDDDDSDNESESNEEWWFILERRTGMNGPNTLVT